MLTKQYQEKGQHRRGKFCINPGSLVSDHLGGLFTNTAYWPVSSLGTFDTRVRLLGVIPNSTSSFVICSCALLATVRYGDLTG